MKIEYTICNITKPWCQALTYKLICGKKQRPDPF